MWSDIHLGYSNKQSPSNIQRVTPSAKAKWTEEVVINETGWEVHYTYLDLRHFEFNVHKKQLLM